MKNSFCEEKCMKKGLTDFHQKMAESMMIPDWALVKCPHCVNRIKERGIRQISICLNARNFGDVSVEYFCEKCGIMDTVYFRKAVTETCDDFAWLVSDNYPAKPKEKPVVEEEMYKLRYNNLVEKFLEERKI